MANHISGPRSSLLDHYLRYTAMNDLDPIVLDSDSESEHDGVDGGANATAKFQFKPINGVIPIDDSQLATSRQNNSKTAANGVLESPVVPIAVPTLSRFDPIPLPTSLNQQKPPYDTSKSARPIAYPRFGTTKRNNSLPHVSVPNPVSGRLDSLKNGSRNSLFELHLLALQPVPNSGQQSSFAAKPRASAPSQTTTETPLYPADIISLSSDSDIEMASVSEDDSDDANERSFLHSSVAQPMHLFQPLHASDPNQFPLTIGLPRFFSANHSTSSSVLFADDHSQSPGMMKPPNGSVEVISRRDASVEKVSDNDDELEILDPLAAAKSTTYKKSTFEMYPQSPPPANSQPSMPGLFPAKQPMQRPVAVPHAGIAFSQEEIVQKELKNRLLLLEKERSTLVQEIPLYTGLMKLSLEMFQSASVQLEKIKAEFLKAKQNGIKTVLNAIKSQLQATELQYGTAQQEYTKFSLELDTLKRKKASLDNMCFQIRKKLGATLNGASQSNNGVHAPATYIPNIYSGGNDDLTESEMKAWMSNMYDEEDLDDSKLPPTPSEMKVTLMKHQRRGLAWLVDMEKSTFKGGILADDMGLGKTVQTIALILHNRPTSQNRRTTLIIAPVSLLRQWAQEIESKINSESKLSLAVFHGNAKKYLKKFANLNNNDVILTSYGTLASEWKKHFKEAILEAKVSKRQNVLPDLNSGGRSYTSPFFAKEAVFNRVVLDEAQAIKNKLSLNAKAVTCLKAEYRFILTGTPIQNTVVELYPFFRFLKARPYNNEERFTQEIALPLKINDTWDSSLKELSLKKLRAILRALVLRRTKDSKIDGKPILQLPPLHSKSEDLVMEKQENDYYFSLQSEIQQKAQVLMEEKTEGVGSGILTLLLRLRQACCHRFLVDVGQMNAAEKENAKAAIELQTITSKKYHMMLKLPKQVTDTIITEYGQEEDDGMFSCAICAMLYPSTLMLIFNKCGHMICRDCVDDFFERYLTLDPYSGIRKATCMKCQSEVDEDKLIPHAMFYDAVIKKLPAQQVIDRQVSSSGSTTTTLTRHKIEELIKTNGGMVKSAKMSRTIELLKEIMEKKPGEKVIVFSQFLVSFEVLAVMLRENKIDFLRYDGTMNIDEKNLTVKQFYQSDIRVLLLSLKAGNVGLTLTCASQVILMEPFWNPFPEDQAIGRAHRIGQNREVQVYRLLTPGTVESRIVELQRRKKELADAALDEDGMRSISRLGRQELGYLFGFNSLERN